MAEGAGDATPVKTGRSSVRAALKRLRRIVSETGRLRLAATAFFLILALLVGRYSWQVPLVADAERSFYDLREAVLAPHVDQDNRIAMVVYNDQTLIDTKKRSPLDRATLARALTQLDRMGAKAIGIDILIDQPQDEDAELIAAFRAMKTPTYIAFADTRSNQDQLIYEQQQYLNAFLARLKGSNVHPASIRLETDSDNVARSWPGHPPGLPEMLVLAMHPAPSFEDYRGSIAWRRPKSADRPVFPSFPIDLFANPAVAPAFAEQIRGRHVLIGGDIVDIDQFMTPLTTLPQQDKDGHPLPGQMMIGLEVHAHLLAQVLDGKLLPVLSSPLLWGIALLTVAFGLLLALLSLRWWWIAAMVVVQVGIVLGLPLWLQARGFDTQHLPALGWGLAWAISFMAMGSAARAVGSQQRRFAQSALGKYLPADIANQILAEPDMLALHGERRPIFVVFTDLEGFTKLSHGIEPEVVANLLNTYLDALSDVVLSYGGTIDKFVGDAVVAFWGAPVARPDDGTRAARAAYAMWQTGEDFRHSIDPSLPPIGKTRVGLHYGDAIVGNFGGEGRIQYTALGDSMNTASRLEAANKSLESNVMASRDAMERSGLDWWRPMGRVLLRGRSTPVEIFEPCPDFPASDRDHLTRAMKELETDREEALSIVRDIANRHPDDEALLNLIYRLENSQAGEAYVLG
ncbi:MAG TPA: adenylate/guanylate cyclase domain-containing protein [Sphingobium sp.]|uniref:adenylate/guanylate cyclase domain-containing protein n=1 Tax=Sphingobium sp. TaxID=1912891 RepID=UPI002ED2CBFC